MLRLLKQDKLVYYIIKLIYIKKESSNKEFLKLKLEREARHFNKQMNKYLKVFILSLLVYFVYCGTKSNNLNKIITLFAEAKEFAERKTEEINDLSSYNLNNIKIIGNYQTSEEDIMGSIYRIDSNNRIKISYSTHDIKNALGKLPLIEKVKVIKKLPHNLVIKLQEKELIAVFRKNNKIQYLIDSHGNIVNYTKDNIGDIVNNLRLPYLEGEEGDLHNFLKIYEHAKKIKFLPRIAKFHRVSSYRWDVVLTNNIIIKLPGIEWENSMNKLVKTDNEIHLIDDVNIICIDLRVSNKVLIKLK